MANLIDDFTGYIEELCRSHTSIGHTDEKKHFIDLSTGEMLQQARSGLHYPVVTMEKLENSYTGREDALRKSRHVELMFLDQVSDRGNFKHVYEVWTGMEWVGEDFLRKIRLDRRNRMRYPFLRTLQIDKAEGFYVEAVWGYLWGYLLSFDTDLPFDDCIEPGRFIDENRMYN